MTYELVGHPTHDFEREATVDPGMGLPHSNGGIRTHGLGALVLLGQKNLRLKNKRLKSVLKHLCGWKPEAFMKN